MVRDMAALANEVDQYERWLRRVGRGRAADALREARIGVTVRADDGMRLINEATKSLEALRFARRLPGWKPWWPRLKCALEAARAQEGG